MREEFKIIGTYDGRTPSNKDGYFMFYVQTTKSKKSNPDGLKAISIPFQGNIKVADKLKEVSNGDIITVFFDITTKNGKDIIYVNLLAFDIEKTI